MSEESGGEELYDIFVLPEIPGSRISDGQADSLVRTLAVMRIIRPIDEALHKDWIEVYSAPGPSSHEPFVRGANPLGDKGAFAEAVVHWGKDPAEIPTDPPSREYFHLAFYGAHFKDVMGKFRVKFRELVLMRPRVVVRPHTGELPEHKEVAEEDKRQDPKRRKRTGNPSGLAGTSVEEW